MCLAGPDLAQFFFFNKMIMIIITTRRRKNVPSLNFYCQRNRLCRLIVVAHLTIFSLSLCQRGKLIRLITQRLHVPHNDRRYSWSVSSLLRPLFRSGSAAPGSSAGLHSAISWSHVKILPFLMCS